MHYNYYLLIVLSLLAIGYFLVKRWQGTPIVENTLFKIDHGRLSLSKTVKLSIKRLSKKRMESISRLHLQNNRMQVAVFAFDSIGINIYEDGVYELRELDAVFAWLSRYKSEMSQSSAIDMGANIGNHSLYFSTFFKTVYSFEPHARTFKLLQFNSELANNIVCFSCALSDRDGTANLADDASNMGAASISEHGQPIRLRRLDDVLSTNDRVWLIKIDVEGHEPEAIAGAEKTIRKNEPVILFEQHPQDIQNGSSRTIDLIRSLGYSKFATIVRGRKVPWLPSSTRLKMMDTFHPDFYPLIVAMPNWMY
jgi:FkbM family methyltransferase